MATGKRRARGYQGGRPKVRRTGEGGYGAQAMVPYVFGPQGPQSSYIPAVGPQYSRSSARARMNMRTGGYLGIELKFYDTYIADTPLVQNGDFTSTEFDPATVDTISAPAQGDGESQRDGRQIIIKKVAIQGILRIQAQTNQTGPDRFPIVKIWLVQDKQTNGEQLDAEEVFTNPGGGEVVGFRKLSNVQRFTVLRSVEIPVNDMNLSWDGTNMEQQGRDFPFAMYWDGNIKVNFTGTTAGVASVTDNSLHIIAVCSSVSAVPTLSYNSRVRFVG